MKLSGQTIEILLTEDGKQVLALASGGLSASNLATVSVEESEDLGIWVRVPRADQMHFFLLRWEYILGIDLPIATGKLIGIRG